MTLFMISSIALALAPGPDNIFVLSQSALYGKRAGWFVTLGLCTGLLFHTAIAALGIAVVLQTSDLAFNTLKFAGALYLLYLAWQAFHAEAAKILESGEDGIKPFSMYLRGVFMNVSNPKVAIFFLAFLPQFADPTKGSIAIQMVMLGGIFLATTLLVFGSIAWMAGVLRGWFIQSNRSQLFLNRLATCVFVLLAIRLILSSQTS